MRVLYGVFFIALLVAAAVGGFCIFLLNSDFIPIDLYHRFDDVRPSVVLDDQDQILFKFELDNRTFVTIDKVPEVLIRAFVAAEDHNFFDHQGVSVRGIARSLVVNLYHRRVVQGASTITQQVARLLFLTHERTWKRKLQEIFLALQLERTHTKLQILELYLNNMYFGRGIYGVEAACQRFWGKSVHDVSLDEAATLAAVAKSAKFFSPLNAPHGAKKRRNIVLESMCKIGFISSQDLAVAKEKSLHLVEPKQSNPIRMYLQEWIRAWAEQRWGKDALYTKGLIIKTTINQQAQIAAEESFVSVIHPLRRKQGDSLNGGAMTIEVHTGAIKAAVGGVNFYQSQFNRAFQAYRQIGSSFKPIMYAEALAAGHELDEVFYDEPVTFIMPNGQKWKPRNWNNQFEGSMTLVRALTYSNNLIAIKLLLKIGSARVVQVAKKFGFTQGLLPYPSLALGTVEGTVVENVAAFNVFANQGVYVEPFLILNVQDRGGSRLWQHEEKKILLLDQKICSKMIRALQIRMELAKKQSKEGWFEAESIGKTGSTNGAVTTWFVGSTPDFTTAVYVGRDDGKPMGSMIFASKTAYPIWLGIHRELPCYQQKFYLDPLLVNTPIDWVTGEYAFPDEQGVYSSRVVTILKESDHAS